MSPGKFYSLMLWLYSATTLSVPIFYMREHSEYLKVARMSHLSLFLINIVSSYTSSITPRSEHRGGYTNIFPYCKPTINILSSVITPLAYVELVVV